MDSKLEPLAALIAGWPGLVSRPDPGLLEDCLVLARWLPTGTRVVDVGAGAGLPGLPLRLVRPDLRLTLLEANRRRAAFLVQACARLGLADVQVVAERAEVAGHDPAHREVYEAAVARALAPMPVLAELCLPLVMVGGRLLAMKTEPAEVEAAATVLRRLGGELLEVAPAPSAARRRGSVAVVAKVRPTPAEYPRRPGVPGRRPLGI